MSEAHQESPPVEPRPFFQPSPNDRVKTFCYLMRHKDAPASFNAKVIQQLMGWKIIPEDTDTTQVAGNYQEFLKLSREAEEEAEESLNFAAFNRDPWNFDKSVEGEYAKEELPDKFPRAIELQSILNEPVHFLFRSEPGQFYLRIIVRADGRRQVLRIIDTDRDINEINADAQKAPAIIPRFEAVRFADNKVGLLIQWIDGRLPNSEERDTCLIHAEELLEIPIDIYDLWAGNFVVSSEIDPATGQPRIYYIDGDIPEAIAQKGYAEVSEERKKQFELGKEKMK